MSHLERRDSTRLVTSLALAVVLHVGLYFGVPVVVSIRSRPAPEYGASVVVLLEEPSPPSVVEPVPTAQVPKVQALPVQKPPEKAPTVAAPVKPPVQKPVAKPPVVKPAETPPAEKPVVQPTPAPKTAEAQPAAQPEVETPAEPFKIPQPAPQTGAARQAAGPSFTEAGGKAGVSSTATGASTSSGATQQAAGSVPAPTPLPQSTAPGGSTTGPSQSQQSTGSVASKGTSTGADAGAVQGTPAGSSDALTQRSGQGVAVTQPATSTTSSSGLDLNKLASVGGTGSAAPAVAQPENVTIEWDNAESGKGRYLIVSPPADIPPSVKSQGLSFTVQIAFSVAPDGLLSKVTMYRSSGNSDADRAVMDAVRRWKFNPGTGTIQGRLSYKLQPK